MPSRRVFMPRALVFWVKPSRMARIPASATGPGVAKSGSPGPKSTMSIPFAIRSWARFITAIVDEISISLTRRVRRMEGLVVVVMSGKALSQGRSQRGPCGRRAPRRDHPHELNDAPSKIHVNHHVTPRRHHELGEPEDEEDQRLVETQLHVHQQEEPEEALENGEQDLLALMDVEGQRPTCASTDDEDDRDHLPNDATLA